MSGDFEIIKKDEEKLSSWVTLVTRTVKASCYKKPQKFHSLNQADYVSVLPVTSDGEVILVKQYRPALEKYTLELPGGLMEEGDNSDGRASAELYEETGYRVTEPLISLGQLDPDTGRLENKLWCYIAKNVKRMSEDAWTPEPGIKVQQVGMSELAMLLNNGLFTHALHIAIIGLAVINKHITLPD